MSNRFILDEDGLRWDRITARNIEGQRDQGPRPTISITGIVGGNDGALLSRLHSIAPRYFALQPGEARSMRDAFVARVTDDPEQLEMTEG